MIKNIYDYFENLKTKELPRNRHNLILDNKKITKVSQKITFTKNEPSELLIDGTSYCSKFNNFEYTVADIASTNMMNSIGIPTPPISTIEQKDKQSILTATQNINTIENFDFSIAAMILLRKEIYKYKVHSNCKWDILYNMEIQEAFLQFMTKECFEQLIELLLIDEIRTEQDRHEDNYFFYKRKSSNKFEGILPIDNELIAILHDFIKNKEDFNNFLYYPYSTPTQLGKLETRPYYKRINDIKELIQDQKLTPKQLNTIKKAISFDLPAEIKETCRNPKLKEYRKITYDAIARLWDFHQKDLGREIE